MTLPTTNAALADRYDAIPYVTIPHALTQPDRLASAASFMGLAVPQVAQARVLEVGCGDGTNLIPMAATVPSARFLGCDLSSRALSAGRETINALGLANVDLVQADLRELPAEHGDFDFIIAHGVYSWVPQDVRDGLFALAQSRLTAGGIMFVSYNALPGSRVRQIAWEILQGHVDHLEDPRARLVSARELAKMIAHGRSFHTSDDAVRAEFRAIAQSSDSELFHDTLGVPNDAFYFRDVATHAARFGLRYLAEADLHSMSSVALPPDTRRFISALDAGSREQYLDFARLRRFRQSLLCRVGAPTDPAPLAERIAPMHVSADRALVQASASGKLDAIVGQLDPSGGGSGPIRALFDTLAQQAPAALPVASLRDRFAGQGLPKAFESLIADACVSNLVILHVHPPGVVSIPGERPRAGALPRHEAATREMLTSLLHTRVRIPDANARRLLTLLDGTRDRAALVAEINGPAFAYQRDAATTYVERALAQFARLGLLAA